MSQDTRKDPRAKVLTMTVRYKSATLDEFIEHHSYDVSRGGMFIKTPSPFPPGTLLKFEVKIAADQKVIQGVGRVVWKRDGENNADTRPAGMGVKFIKIDDASRKVIDTLVGSRGDASSAYEAGGGDGGGIPAPLAASAKAPAAAEGARSPMARKGTMIGLGAMNPANRPQVASTPEKPAASFFPATKSEADMPPPEDRTVMKQAAELLQDALREAGGSMADVGASSKYADPPAKSAPVKAVDVEATPIAPRSEPASAPAAPKAEVKASSEKPAPAPVKSLPAQSKSTIPAARRAAAASPAHAARRVSVPAAAPAASSGGGGSVRVVVIVLVLAATAGLVYAFSTNNAPAPAPSVSAEPAPAPSAAPVPTESASAAPAESAAPVESAAPPASGSAAPAASAPAAPTPPVPPPVVNAPVVPTPKAAPVQPARPTPKSKPAVVAEPSEPSAPSPAAPSVPTVNKPAVPAPTPKPEAPPTPKPKPVEPAGDNPY